MVLAHENQAVARSFGWGAFATAALIGAVISLIHSTRQGNVVWFLSFCVWIGAFLAGLYAFVEIVYNPF